jgi:hypothetical protein
MIIDSRITVIELVVIGSIMRVSPPQVQFFTQRMLRASFVQPNQILTSG